MIGWRRSRADTMRPNAFNPNESRREVLHAAGRFALLGSLAWVSVALGRRAGADPRCRDRALCGRCAALGHCNLPAALRARRAQPGDIE